jgi:hypothetical protein
VKGIENKKIYLGKEQQNRTMHRVWTPELLVSYNNQESVVLRKDRNMHQY